MPRHADAGSSEAPLAATPTAGAGPTHVLVVDSDERGHTLVETALAEEDGLLLERAHTTESALRRLGEGEIGIVLVATRLPGRGGLELIGSLRDRGLHTPAILIAEHDDPVLDVEALRAGAADFLDHAALAGGRLARSIRYALARARDGERLRQQTQYDELTGLANRALFQDRLAHALAAARRHRHFVGVIILDLNGFKPINDRFGHGAGDALLRLMGERLRGRLRETDTVARLGGDEFGIVVEDLVEPEHAAVVARKLLDALAPPAQIDGVGLRITASLGVAVFPQDGDDADLLCRRADSAMYRAKADGGHVCRFHDESSEIRLRRGALLESDLRRALDQDEIVLLFQPQVTLRPGALGLAAIPRWRHPDLGLIGSDRFLGLAADVGLLEAIGDRVLEAACAQARVWCAQLGARVHVAIPLILRRRLAWSDVATRLRRCLDAQRLDPSRIELELDETTWLADIEAGGRALAGLAATGVRLALANYGGGTFSLHALAPPALTTLKLDRGLLAGIPDDRRRAAVVAAVLRLGQEVGMRLVAEGVDRADQLAWLRRTGCDAVQTSLACPPLPADACRAWIAQATTRGTVAEPRPPEKA